MVNYLQFQFKDEIMAELRRVKQNTGHSLSEGYVEKEISAMRKDLDTRYYDILGTS